MIDRLFRAFLLVATLSSGLLTPPARAQAVPSADRKLSVKVYGLVSYVRPEFQGGRRNAGGTVGANIDGFRFLRYTDVGLDVRYAASGGSVSNQYLLAGGPRVSFNAFRLQPYADYLFGRGNATFNRSTDPFYTTDTSGVRSYGGGVDFKVSRSWAIRADVQRQGWRFTTRAPYFYPLDVSVGASYQLHFHSRFGPD